MTNISIISIADKTTKETKWYVKIVLWLIRTASGSDWTHSQMMINDTLYESTYPGGFKKTENYVFAQRDNNLQQSYPRDATSDELLLHKSWWEYKISIGSKYGVLKLLIYTPLFWTRRFWEMINFYPFAYDKVWGEFCSAACIECSKFVSGATGDIMWDLLPGRSAEIGTPGDIVEEMNKK